MKRNKKAMGKVSCANFQLLGYQYLNHLCGSIPLVKESRKTAEGSIQMLRCFLECNSFFPAFFALVQSLRLPMYRTFDSRLTPMAGWMYCGCFAKSKVFVDKPRRVLFALIQHSFQS